MPAKLEKCVRDVKAKGDADSAWAVCKASLGECTTQECQCEECRAVRECKATHKPGPCKKSGGAKKPAARSTRNISPSGATPKQIATANKRTGGGAKSDKKLVRSKTAAGKRNEVKSGSGKGGIKVTKRAGGAALPIPKKPTANWRGIKGINDQRQRRITGYYLGEQIFAIGKPERVDREKGVLYKVKILGLKSVNNRRYTPEAVKAAVGLYEGVGVYTNHPRKPDDPRDVRDRFGWFEEVALSPDGGLIGDFHLLDPGDPLSVKLMNAAESNPTLFGFSHNAEGDGHTDGTGVFVVEQITDVRSVDLVSEPATTNGLFEHRNREKRTMKISAFLEAISTHATSRARKALKKLLEEVPVDDLMDDEMDYEEPSGSNWRKSLAAVYGEMMSSEDPEAQDVGNKIHSILKAKPAGEPVEEEGEEEEEPVAEEEEEKDVEEEEEKDVKEEEEKDEKKTESHRLRLTPGKKQLVERVAKLEAERDLAELKGWLREQVDARKLPWSDKLQKTCLALNNRKIITEHLDHLKTLIPAQNGRQIRSQAPGGQRFSESRGFDPERVTDSKSFVEALRCG